MEDLTALYEKSFSVQTVTAISKLPHPTIQKFAVITVAIVCASRRFLAQITRHQNEVKFMSASLQYSNYAGQADFAVPVCYYDCAEGNGTGNVSWKAVNASMECYEEPVRGRDRARCGAAMPRPRAITECADYQRHALPVETYHRPAGMPAQYGRDPDRAPENLAGAFFVEPGTLLLPITDRPFLPEGSMPGG
ncbi:MAG: FAD-dependent thymidylate synthase [Lachnospiraceae bacterium]